MTALANKETARRVYSDIINGRQFDKLGDYIAPDFTEHEEFPGLEGLHGPASVQAWVEAMTTAFPDFSCEVERMAADGDLVMAQITIRGTHQGAMFGIPATGATVEVCGVDIGRFENGKVVEHWGVTDQLELLRQLGAVPAAETTATEVHREVHRLFNNRRFAEITAQMAEGNFVDHPRGLTMKSPSEFETWMRDWTAAFPDAVIGEATYYAAGNRSICAFTARGTNTGPLGPLPATGNRIELQFCEHLVCDDSGRITGSEIYYDQMSMLVQLGHAQAPPA